MKWDVCRAYHVFAIPTLLAMVVYQSHYGSDVHLVVTLACLLSTLASFAVSEGVR